MDAINKITMLLKNTYTIIKLSCPYLLKATFQFIIASLTKHKIKTRSQQITLIDQGQKRSRLSQKRFDMKSN